MTHILKVTAAILAAVFGSVYGSRDEKAGKRILVFKALATMCAAAPALWAAWFNGGRYLWTLAIGLLLCMAADVLLEIWFLSGVIVFGGAHVCLISAWFPMVVVRNYTIMFGAVIYLIFFIAFHKWLPRLGHLKIPGIIYPALLGSMAALAFTFGVQSQNFHAITAAVGAGLFVVSDFILAYRALEQKKERIFRTAVLVCYFSAIYFIAL